MGENDFEREVLDRLVKLESKMDMVLDQCPRCRNDVTQHGLQLAAQEERIQGIYRTSMVVAAIVSAVVQFAAMLLGAIKWH